jgi:putative DNA primase/helicase
MTDFNQTEKDRAKEQLNAEIAAKDYRMPHPPTIAAARSDGVVLVNGADLTPTPVDWLWQHWLAMGKLHILAGDPGQGKTTIAIALAATVTIGGLWPDGSRTEPGNVVIWSGEDDPADTLLPRLLAAGADRNRVYFVTGSQIKGEIHSFDPARDMIALERQVNEIGGARLLIIDPVVSAVTGDSHKNTEVRRSLKPLVDLASRLNAALLGISHFSKGGAGSNPMSRVVGSIAFTAVARVVLVAAKVASEDGSDRRILARSKSNIGPDDGGYEYRIEQTEALPGIQASRIEWGPLVEGTARELLTDPDAPADAGKGESAIGAASDFLRQVLADGPVPAKKVQDEAKHAGVSWASVRRASDAMMVSKTKGANGSWYWKLHKLPDHVAQQTHVQASEHLEQDDSSDPPQVAENPGVVIELAQQAHASDAEPHEHLDPEAADQPVETPPVTDEVENF